MPSVFSMLALVREELGAAIEDIAFATVFTTQDAIGEIRRLADAARAEPVPEVRELERLELDKAEQSLRDAVTLVRGVIDMPGFQRGDIPYARFGDGGAIVWGADGLPEVDHHERTRVGFMIPRKRRMPDSGWPVVLMSHGTGASYRSAYRTEIAAVLAGHGMAVVSYDPTLHGPRDPTSSDPRLTFFNLFNIVAGRDNIRQGAADCVVMTKLLKSGFSVPSDVTGAGPAHFDADKIAFLGHSQGGLIGAPCVVVEPAFKAVVFSGTSGLLNITLQERKEPVDFARLLRNLLDIPDSEPLDDLHPVLNLLQTFIEPSDPIAYAPSWLSAPPDGVSRDLLLIEGFLDSASPARGHEALATAAGIPLIAPHHRVPFGATLVGPQPQAAPAHANVMSEAGAVTAGLIQYPTRDHWPIFNDVDANLRYAEFLRSALFDGRAQIIVSRYAN